VTPFEWISLIVTLVALLSWLNCRWIRLPTAVGLLLTALLFSFGIVILGGLGVPVEQPFEHWIGGFDFGRTFLHGMLGAMLFAGALKVDLSALRRHRVLIAILSTVGVALSTLLLGSAVWWLLHWIGHPVPYPFCLLFGALLAPTDPIAVLAILRDAQVPEALETHLVGEALFNDGVGVVLFVVILEAASPTQHAGSSNALWLLLREAGGGLAYGALLGVVVNRMLRSIDEARVEILLTLAVVTGGYALASVLGISGPLAMVVAGLAVGNHGRQHSMSGATRERLDVFWELVDALLVAVLFVLIGLEVVALDFDPLSLSVGLAAIPLVLAARLVSVAAAVRVLRAWRRFEPHTVEILTWSGVRGGISVALALSLPHGPERDIFVGATYVVVSASILLQGLTLGRFVRHLGEGRADRGARL
jgi:CPA1 family monovalent cation:H+ antiporter